jgi:hypothetical protein
MPELLRPNPAPTIAIHRFPVHLHPGATSQHPFSQER